jgi:hypothetical protein
MNFLKDTLEGIQKFIVLSVMRCSKVDPYGFIWRVRDTMKYERKDQNARANGFVILFSFIEAILISFIAAMLITAKR